jgi:hypothetical protein
MPLLWALRFFVLRNVPHSQEDNGLLGDTEQKPSVFKYDLIYEGV